MTAVFSQLGRSLLHIKSDDDNAHRKGRLLQSLLALSVIISFGRIGFSVFQTSTTAQSFDLASFAYSSVSTILFAVTCLRFIHNGRLRWASHIFCGGLLFVFLGVLFISPDASIALAYLALIPIVAIAVLESIAASVFYTLLTITAVVIINQFSPNQSVEDLIFFLLTTIGVSITVWTTSRDLRRAVGAADKLTRDVRRTNALLQRRARQLQASAEIGQQTSASLELETLLKTAVGQITDQFGLYHVSIFLADPQNQTLQLAEASGDAGRQLTAQKYTLPIDETSIVGWTAVHKQPRISNDVQSDTHFKTEAALAATQAEIALPLIARGQLHGVLDAQSKTINAFQQDDVAILQIVANQIAINIDNARLFAQTQTRLDETKMLYNLNTLLTTTLDVGEIYRRAAREFTLMLNATRCAISSWEPKENQITAQAEFVHDPDNSQYETYVTDYETYDLTNFPHVVRVLETHQPFVGSVTDDTLNASERERLTAVAQKIALEIPLVYGVEALGVVTLYRDDRRSPFDAGEIQLAQTMANQTAVALNNAILTSNTRGQLAQFSSLHRMSNILAQAPNLKAIFDGARREILGLVEASGMSISLLTPDGERLNWIYGFEYGQEVDLSQIPPLPITEGFSGHVARSRDIFYVQKADDLRDEFDSITVGADLGYWLGLPMIVANELVGVLAVENDTSFTKRDIELLKTIVGPLAIAINNLIQFEEVQSALELQFRQRIQLQTAAEVAAAATSVANLTDLMQNAVDLIKERFELYYVGLFLVDDGGQNAVLRAGTGAAGQAQLAAGRCLEIGGQSLIGGATADGTPRITQDVTADAEWLPNPHLPYTRSELALPLQVRDRVIGALTVQSEVPNVFDESLIGTLHTMSDQLAVAIENAQLLASAEAEARDQELLNQVSTQFHQSADVNQIVSLGLQAISDRLRGADVHIALGAHAAPDDDADPPTNGRSQ